MTALRMARANQVPRSNHAIFDSSDSSEAGNGQSGTILVYSDGYERNRMNVINELVP